MKKNKRINFQRKLRTRRTRAGVRGTSEKPRLTVFRSNKFIYAQLIDDQQQKTLAAASTKELIDGEPGKKLTKTARAEELGRMLAAKAKKMEIKAVVFDKGPYHYHGRIRAVAEGARQAGLKF